MTLLSPANGLLGQSNLLNGDFETWNTSADMNPTGWCSINWTAVQFGAPYTCSQSTDKHSGSYAMKITTINFAGNVVDGIAFIGKWDNPPGEFPQFGYPYTKRPIKLKGYYKFSSTSGDSGLVGMRLTSWNSSLGRQDTIADGLFYTLPTSTYTYFEIPILYYLPGLPDTASVIVLGSAETTITERGKAGNTLYIDDLSYEYASGITEPLMAESSLSIFPNPGTGYVTVGLPGRPGPARLRVYDQMGKAILCMQMENANAEIDLSAYSSGIYHIYVESNGTVLSGKFSKID